MPESPIVLPTVDCDPGRTFPCRIRSEQGDVVSETTAVEQYDRAVVSLMDIFDRHGLAGKVTWFVNEADVNWSANYPHLLGKFIERGDTVGLHTHFRGLFGNPVIESYSEALAACGAGKAGLEAVTGEKIFAHRCGCFYQSGRIYRALAELGFTVLSDVNPGRETPNALGGTLDNSSVPVAARPWRHDPDNWTEWSCREGCFLHLPVATEGLEALEQFASRVKTHKIPVASWDIHPHEIQGPDGQVAPDLVGRLDEALSGIQKDLSPASMNFAEALSALGEIHPA